MNYIVTLNLGEFLPNTARESFRAAASRWGADYIELMSGNPRDSLESKRTTLHTRLPQKGRFLFVDADTLIHSNCPNLFDCVPEKSFGAVLSEQPGHRAHGKDRIEILRNYLSTTDCSAFSKMSDEEILNNYINTGMMVFSFPEHIPVFERAASFPRPPGHWIISDQTPISAAICEKTTLHRLPPSFNRCGEKLWIKWVPQMDDFVWHFCGGLYESPKNHLTYTNWNYCGPAKYSGGTKVWERGRPISLHWGTEVPFLYWWGCPLVKRGFHAVEIGAYLGGFTEHLLRMSEGQDALVESVDPFTGSPDLNADWESTCVGFLQNVDSIRSSLVDPPSFRHVKHPSPSALEQIEAPIDLLLVDGNHTYEGARADIEAAIPKMNPDGLIFVHDVCPKFPGVVRATSELLGQPLDKSHGDYCMAVYRVPHGRGT